MPRPQSGPVRSRIWGGEGGWGRGRTGAGQERDGGGAQVYSILKKRTSRGAWVAQSVEHQTLDFGSGHDLMVGEFKPCAGLCT